MEDGKRDANRQLHHAMFAPLVFPILVLAFCSSPFLPPSFPLSLGFQPATFAPSSVPTYHPPHFTFLSATKSQISREDEEEESSPHAHVSRDFPFFSPHSYTQFSPQLSSSIEISQSPPFPSSLLPTQGDPSVPDTQPRKCEECSAVEGEERRPPPPLGPARVQRKQRKETRRKRKNLVASASRKLFPFFAA